MKIIIFSFKHRHRFKDLNNFLSTKKYGQFLIINLSGPIKYLLAKLCIKLNIGKGFSCDGRPLIKDQKKGINFWMRGNSLNIPVHLRELRNNYTNIRNPIVKDNNIFQIYPIKIVKSEPRKKMQIIFISNIKIKKNNQIIRIWNQNKKLIKKDFSLIDNINFWNKNIPIKKKEHRFVVYKEIKNLLRLEIIKSLKKKFKGKMLLIGDDWKKYDLKSLNNNYNVNFIKKIYNGNICIDTGSIEGSSSLYPRSIQIIESGGLIIQSKQKDSNKIWNKLEKKILFNSIDDGINLISEYLNNIKYANNMINNINNNFNSSEKKIENNLKRIFK